MDDRRAGGQFAGSYPSPNASIPLQPAQHYLYSGANTANNLTPSSSATTHRHPQQQPKPFHPAVGEQPQHMSLPPIQHFESHGGMQSHSHSQPPQSQSQYQHQHQHQHPQPPPYASAPPPPYPPSQYHQYQNGALPASMQPGMSSNGPNGMVRYALPPQQPPLGSRQLNDNRHKKEIKRRTKTGCLTCRKRRIKCDEGHPTCRNCQKSKRECLGYDPIFKQQPGPANIQPAPSGSDTPASLINNNPINGATVAGTSTVGPNQYPVTQSYPGTGGTFNPISGATQGADGQYEYGNPLDPALGGGDVMSQNHYSHALQLQRKVKHVSVEELFTLNNIPPRYNRREKPPSVVPSAREDVEAFYKYHYAVGLDRLFETSWYSAQGLAHVFSDATLHDFVAQCTEQFKAKTENDESLLSLEARLVWQLAIMPRAAASASTEPASNVLIQELLTRIDIIENLLTGQFLDPTKIPPLESTAVGTANPQGERSFWHNLGRLVSLRDDLVNPSTLRDVNDVLGHMRHNLHMQENRDVLYSLAIARHIGGRMPEFHPHRQLVASTADQNDDVNKLRIAYDFIELQDHRGTTQVIQRICSMSIRSWILQKQ